MQHRSNVTTSSGTSHPTKAVRQLITHGANHHRSTIKRISIGNANHLKRVSSRSRVITPTGNLSTKRVRSVTNSVKDIITSRPFNLQHRRNFRHVMLRNPTKLITTSRDRKCTFFFRLVRQPRSNVILPQHHRSTVTQTSRSFRSRIRDHHQIIHRDSIMFQPTIGRNLRIVLNLRSRTVNLRNVSINPTKQITSDP